MGNKEKKARPMLQDLKTLIVRASPTLLQDLAGATLLIAMLAIGLHLPLTL